MFLSEDEVRDLTGYKRPADQRRWLSERGIAFWTSARGRPKVLRSEIESSARQQSGQPDWSLLP